MPTEVGKTVRELVLDNPAAARVFENLGIDYCCGGERSLAEACGEANVRVDEAIAALEKSVPVPTDRDWSNVPLAELARYIIEKHHSFTRNEIKRLSPLLAKVVSVHGTNHPELAGVQSLFRSMSQELIEHMGKEEEMLFPYIEELEGAIKSKRAVPSSPFGTVENPVRMMMMEHESTGQVLHKIRETTKGYLPPPDACASYQILLGALEAFEKDIHVHIHLENNILFPRAINLESAAI
jgi:regulator of cell morphogenesis and NO signaling